MRDFVVDGEVARGAQCEVVGDCGGGDSGPRLDGWRLLDETIVRREVIPVE